MSTETIALGCDHAAVDLKETVKAALVKKGFDVKDMGTFGPESVDYCDYARSVAKPVSEGVYKRGILICGSGIGMSMAANRFNGVRAALCNDLFSAQMSRLHNDANVLCMGARFIGEGLALAILDKWLETAFEGGRHQRRIDKMDL